MGGNVRIRAFADHLILTKDEQIKLIKDFNEWITNNILTLNRYKTELLNVNRVHRRNLPAENSYNIEGIELNSKKLEAKKKNQI